MRNHGKLEMQWTDAPHPEQCQWLPTASSAVQRTGRRSQPTTNKLGFRQKEWPQHLA